MGEWHATTASVHGVFASLAGTPARRLGVDTQRWALVQGDPEMGESLWALFNVDPNGGRSGVFTSGGHLGNTNQEAYDRLQAYMQAFQLVEHERQDN